MYKYIIIIIFQYKILYNNNNNNKNFSKEVRQIRQSCYLKGVHLSLYYVTSRIVLFICFIVYNYLYGGHLTAHKVFVTMALFNVIRIPVTRHLPQSIAATAELIVTCDRIQVNYFIDFI